MKEPLCPHCQSKLTKSVEPTLNIWRCSYDHLGSTFCPIRYRENIDPIQGTLYYYIKIFEGIELAVFPKSEKISLYLIEEGNSKRFTIHLPITNLPLNDLEALRKKVKLWMTFS